MWVDIIPKIRESRVIPPIINITPRKPIKYVFRIVLWSVADVVLPANQKTGDYYVTRYIQLVASNSSISYTVEPLVRTPLYKGHFSCSILILYYAPQ